TRGFSAEFGTATTVLLCSRLGMPVSTTHVAVGNIIGVGLARGISAINLSVIKRIFSAWIISLPAAGLFSVAIYLILSTLFA
ncbi:MAG: phosphate permease, partial [Candidatus Aminicenantes bacterium]|nr:phosphate permease [Candidatus Aminicenantes bacterium]